jgi:hypothetical protein
MLFGQGIKASFTLRTLPDNTWYLELKKDNTYKYLHWSGFGGNPTVLDSGTYSLENLKLITKSQIENNTKGRKFNDYYIHKIKVKKYQTLLGVDSKHRKFAVFGKKYLILSKGQFNYSRIISYRPKDRIETDTIDSKVNLKKWISEKIIPRYGYGKNGIELPDSSWLNLLKNDKIEVILINNSSDLFEVFYLVNNCVYTSSMHKQLNGQKAVIRQLEKEKHITRKEGIFLITEIEKNI